MDTAAMGFARWHAGWAAARDSQLLDEHILVRFGGGVGGSAGVGGMAEIAQNDFSGTSPGSRRRYSRAGQQPALRGIGFHHSVCGRNDSLVDGTKSSIR